MDSKSHSQKIFPIWKTTLDELCKKIYYIDTADMGWSDDQLDHHRQMDTSPDEMCQYLGMKFNLTLVEEISWNSKIGT